MGLAMDLGNFGLGPEAFWAAVAVTLFAGFVKGAVGFAMPLIMISSFSAFLEPEQALAGLILPTVVTNISQATRQGMGAARDSVTKYHRFLIATLVLIVISAQFVRAIPQELFLILLGVPITAFALAQLSGRKLALKLQHRHRAEWVMGAIGGLYGGVSGVWGPPLIVYLLSTGADKVETVKSNTTTHCFYLSYDYIRRTTCVGNYCSKWGFQSFTNNIHTKSLVIIFQFITEFGM